MLNPEKFLEPQLWSQLSEVFRTVTYAPLLNAIGVWSGTLPIHWTITFSTLAVVTIAHVIVVNREPRSSLGWIGAILLSPLLGIFFYVIFGINRVQRKARKVRIKRIRRSGMPPQLKFKNTLTEEIPIPERLTELSEMGISLNGSSFLPGHTVQCLNTGDEAYPRMIEVILGAKKTICIQSYIFDADEVGNEFATALHQAQSRGVTIRVLVDDVGAGLPFKSIVRKLHRLGIKAAVYLPFILNTPLSNLRNHRKLMVVDGEIAFTGGLNIAQIYWPSRSQYPVLDVHFEVKGPLVQDLTEAFAIDWFDSTGEALQESDWIRQQDEPKSGLSQKTWARVVRDGPEAGEERLIWHTMGLIQAAKSSIQIVTPYFLPVPAIEAALISAAQRGVQVEITLPGKTDTRLVGWASRAMWGELLRAGCQIRLSPTPFDHSKLFVVDRQIASIGSANWDPRSFWLNYELNVELFGEVACGQIAQIVDQKRSKATPYSFEQWASRSFPQRLLDGFARLFTPVL